MPGRAHQRMMLFGALSLLSLLMAMDLTDLKAFMQQNQGFSKKSIMQDTYNLEDSGKIREQLLESFTNVPLLSASFAQTSRLVKTYYAESGELPPDSVIQPLLETALARKDYIYISQLQKLIEELDLAFAFNHQGLTSKQMNRMKRLLDDYRTSPGLFQGDIDRLYPLNKEMDLDKAVLFSAKYATLIQRWVKEQMGKGKDVLKRAFNDRDVRESVFQKRLGFYLDLFTTNVINRLLLDARSKNDRNAIVQVYRLVRESYEPSLEGQIPFEIEMTLKRMNITDQRTLSYLRFKLMALNCVKNAFTPYFYTDNLIKMGPLYNLAHSQILASLAPFLSEEEKGGEPEKIPEVIGELERKLLTMNFQARTTGDQINTLFWNRINVMIPNLIKTVPKFAIFADLNDDELKMLLQPNKVQQIGGDKSFLDFSLLEEQEDIEGPKKMALKRKRPKKPTKPKTDSKQTKQIAFEDKEKIEGSVTISTAEEKDTATDPVKSTSEEKTPSSNEQSPAENVGVGGFIETAVVDGTEAPEVDDEEEIEKEVMELMKQEQATINRYRDMKRADSNHTALYNKQMKVMDASTIGRKKPKMVAFFDTDDFRFIHNEANNLYLENEVNKTAELVANSKGPVKLQWIFNPNVVIDSDTYLFLCQVFNLIPGTNRLNYNNFLKAFIKLNPSAAETLQKKTKYANRTVFQFSHAIETDGMIYIPPIGGVHPEHASSRFNHIQVRKFLTHGGAHPYFFRQIE